MMFNICYRDLFKRMILLVEIKHKQVLYIYIPKETVIKTKTDHYPFFY